MATVDGRAAGFVGFGGARDTESGDGGSCTPSTSIRIAGGAVSAHLCLPTLTRGWPTSATCEACCGLPLATCGRASSTSAAVGFERTFVAAWRCRVSWCQNCATPGRSGSWEPGTAQRRWFRVRLERHYSSSSRRTQRRQMGVSVGCSRRHIAIQATSSGNIPIYRRLRPNSSRTEVRSKMWMHRYLSHRTELCRLTGSTGARATSRS